MLIIQSAECTCVQWKLLQVTERRVTDDITSAFWWAEQMPDEKCSLFTSLLMFAISIYVNTLHRFCIQAAFVFVFVFVSLFMTRYSGDGTWLTSTTSSILHRKSFVLNARPHDARRRGRRIKRIKGPLNKALCKGATETVWASFLSTSLWVVFVCCVAREKSLESGKSQAKSERRKITPMKLVERGCLATVFQRRKKWKTAWLWRPGVTVHKEHPLVNFTQFRADRSSMQEKARQVLQINRSLQGHNWWQSTLCKKGKERDREKGSSCHSAIKWIYFLPSALCDQEKCSLQ